MPPKKDNINPADPVKTEVDRILAKQGLSVENLWLAILGGSPDGLQIFDQALREAESRLSRGRSTEILQ